MKILYFSPPGINKSPQVLVAEELSKRGHEVTLVESTSSFIRSGRFDVVVGAMEASCEIAFNSAKALGLPVYLHAEWVPPWRVGLELPTLWGFEPGQRNGALTFWVSFYSKVISLLLQADAYSMAGHYPLRVMEDFSKKKLENARFRYPAVDFNLIKELESIDIKEEDQIITIARLVPNKKVSLTAKALALLNLPLVWAIIGKGPEETTIKRILKGSKVKVKFLGAFSGKKKFLEIKRSMFSVQNWSGIPPAESFLLGKPCVSMAHPYMLELYADTLKWGPNNDIEKQAENIQELIKNPETRQTLAAYAKKKFLEEKLNVKTTTEIAIFIEKICEEICSKPS